MVSVGYLPKSFPVKQSASSMPNDKMSKYRYSQLTTEYAATSTSSQNNYLCWFCAWIKFESNQNLQLCKLKEYFQTTSISCPIDNLKYLRFNLLGNFDRVTTYDHRIRHTSKIKTPTLEILISALVLPSSSARDDVTFIFFAWSRIAFSCSNTFCPQKRKHNIRQMKTS